MECEEPGRTAWRPDVAQRPIQHKCLGQGRDAAHSEPTREGPSSREITHAPSPRAANQRCPRAGAARTPSWNSLLALDRKESGEDRDPTHEVGGRVDRVDVPTDAFVGRVRPVVSSPVTRCVGWRSAMSWRIRSSIARSASVTYVPSGFTSHIEVAAKMHPWPSTQRCRRIPVRMPARNVARACWFGGDRGSTCRHRSRSVPRQPGPFDVASGPQMNGFRTGPPGSLSSAETNQWRMSSKSLHGR